MILHPILFTPLLHACVEGELVFLGEHSVCYKHCKGCGGMHSFLGRTHHCQTCELECTKTVLLKVIS